MADLIGFLRGRGLQESLLQNMLDDKIDAEVLNMMDDTAMKTYIPKYGDRLAATAYCSSFKSPGQSADGQTFLTNTVDRLRDRITSRKRRSRPQTTNDIKTTTTLSVEKTVRPKKLTRRVELGWKHFNSSSGCYHQIRAANGGGTRHLEIEKDMSADAVMAVSKSLYFPEGVSKKGKAEDYIFSLKDFQMEDVGCRTIEQIYDQTKVKLLRLYLCTKNIDNDKKEIQPNPSASTSTTKDNSQPGQVIDLSVDEDLGDEDLPSFIDIPLHGDDVETLPDITAEHGAELSAQISSTSGTSGTGEGSQQTQIQTQIPLSSGTPTITFRRSFGSRLRRPRRLSPETQTSLPKPDSEDRPDTENRPGTEVVVAKPQGPDDVAMETMHSLIDANPRVETVSERLSDILQRLEQNIIYDSKNIINVDRANVLDGGFRGFGRSSFNPWKRLDVHFVDEDGIDGGGPMREFMRLSVQSVRSLPIFSRDDNRGKSFVLDYNNINKNVYFKAGQILAYSIVHRGPFPTFLSPLMYSALAESRHTDPQIEDIPDEELRSKVQMIQSSQTQAEYREAVEKAEDTIILAGCSSFSLNFSPTSKSDLIKSLCRFLCLDLIRIPLEQFRQGLQTLSLASEIHKNQAEWKEVFVFPDAPLQLDHQQIGALFEVKWSTEGSNKKRDEKRTMSYWMDLLQDLEDGVDGPLTGRQLNLEDALIFITGSSSVPTLGFDPQPTLSFIHHCDVTSPHLAGMPTSNTCSVEVRLPVVGDFETFKSNLLAAFDAGTTFTTL